ncbi:protease modulator HflC [Alkalisalibacterium limincola]|uniref:Protein HflC n=1 Tax=Alkalisalibacterium limincola TaxID=2699169 RepID=A0A5C8KXY4_9GAMM|nr:protease modulator HflC [Alkalisalibacterium limincola]TXK65948.1 protease modulator HflC [Alkalisalibacterium limincola]
MRNIILIALALLVLLGMGAVYQVQESQVALRLQFGRVIEEGIQPGLHFKLPVVQDVMRFDRRILTLDSRPERYLTFEKKDVNVDFFVKWRISDVRRYYQSTGGNEENARERLRPIVTETIRNEIAQRTLQAVVAGERADLAQRFIEVSNRGAESLGVQVVDVRIKRIDLPEDSQVIESVFNRMRAERLRVANELRAEGQEVLLSITSEADRAVTVLLADAERDAQRLRGEGDARAAEIYASAFGADAEFYAFYRSLEAYRGAFADGQGVMVLDRDAEFLRYFEDGPRR